MLYSHHQQRGGPQKWTQKNLETATQKCANFAPQKSRYVTCNTAVTVTVTAHVTLQQKSGRRPYARWEMNPEMIRPYHEVRDPRKVSRLAADMRKRGWIGRPVLAVGCESQGDCQALTATHRIAAAINAGLEDVPVYWIEPTADQWEQIESATEQEDVLEALKEIDPEAAKIYAQEPGII